MDIPRAIDGRAPPVILAQVGGADEFGAAPGGRPVGFPDGIDYIAFRETIIQREGISREEFNRRYPRPSIEIALRDAGAGIVRIYRRVTGGAEPPAGEVAPPAGGEQLGQVRDGAPLKPPLVIVFLDP